MGHWHQFFLVFPARVKISIYSSQRNQGNFCMKHFNTHLKPSLKQENMQFGITLSLRSRYQNWFPHFNLSSKYSVLNQSITQTDFVLSSHCHLAGNIPIMLGEISFESMHTRSSWGLPIKILVRLRIQFILDTTKGYFGDMILKAGIQGTRRKESSFESIFWFHFSLDKCPPHML